MSRENRYKHSFFALVEELSLGELLEILEEVFQQPTINYSIPNIQDWYGPELPVYMGIETDDHRDYKGFVGVDDSGHNPCIFMQPEDYLVRSVTWEDGTIFSVKREYDLAGIATKLFAAIKKSSMEVLRVKKSEAKWYVTPTKSYYMEGDKYVMVAQKELNRRRKEIYDGLKIGD